MNSRTLDMDRIEQDQQALSRLIELLGAERVGLDLAERQLYSMDFSEEVGETAMAVLRPRSVEDLSAIMRIAQEEGLAVNTRGGGMSYTKGHVPVRPRTVVVDNAVFNVNTTSGVRLSLVSSSTCDTVTSLAASKVASSSPLIAVTVTYGRPR